jgi:two-component system, OmpR family, sensor histidine kinase ArlS
MTIRARLTLRFTTIVSAITIAISLIVHGFSSYHRQQEFDERLFNEAQHTLNLFFEVDEVNPDLLRKIKDTDSSIVAEYLTIHGPNGEVLFNTSGGEATLLHAEFLLKAAQNPPAQIYQGSDNNRDYVTFAYNHKGRASHVVISAVDYWGLEQLRFLRLILVACCLSAMLLAAPLGYLYSGRMLQPIMRMVNEIGEINALSAGSRRGKRLSTGNERDELERLAVTVNRMLQRLEQSLDAQRNFVASASHELRSPLTALAGQIEVALRQPRSTSEYRSLLESLTDDLNRLTELTNGLLTLAKTDAIVDMPTINYRVDELVDEAIVEILRRDKNWQVDVDYEEFPEDDELFNAVGNNNLLRIALVNILDNACKYSPNHKAELQVGLTQETIVLQCIDHGIGVPDSEKEKVFGRFFRASNSGGIRGHGLGLPLARRITELHGGDLQLVSELNKGTVVTMTVQRHTGRKA